MKNIIITGVRKTDSFLIQMSAGDLGTLNRLLTYLGIQSEKNQDKPAIEFIQEFTDKSLRAIQAIENQRRQK